MAATNLGGVFVTKKNTGIGDSPVVSSEFVCGMVFDTKAVGGFSKAFSAGSTAEKNFGKGGVAELNSSNDIALAGIDDTVMHGLPLYHIKSFLTLAGQGQRLFVSFMDSTEDPDFKAVERIQRAANGIIYQIGVWTAEAVAVAGSGDKYGIAENNVISKLNAVAEILGGRVGQTNLEGNAPVSIWLNAPVINAAECDIKKIPDFKALDAPYVSFSVGQIASQEVHDIQLALTTDTCFPIVGNIGAAMGCFAVAPVDESIAHVKNFNISVIGTQAELGFGNLVKDTAGTAWSQDVSFTNVKSLGYSDENVRLHQNGIVFIGGYDGLENSLFFMSDCTLASTETTGKYTDYRKVSRCRTMHKACRLVRLALLPKAHETVDINADTGYMSQEALTDYQNVVYNALDAGMYRPGTKTAQISSRAVSIATEQNILADDALVMELGIVPRGETSAIYANIAFKTTVSV